jgi:FkbM family methyltransferase
VKEKAMSISINENLFFKIKLFLKKIPVLVKINKFIWPILNNLHINFINKFIINNKKITFDNTENSKELLVVNNYSEKYIVNSSDKTIGRSLYINGEFEFDLFLDALKILQNKKYKKLIDIGANIGTICIPAIKRGIFECSLAIEPEPYNYNLLNKNIFINDLNKKIKTLNIACGQVDNEKLKLELSVDNFGDHQIKSNSNEINIYNDDRRKVITVNTKKLDTVIKSFNLKETLIWIDTQGYEGFILDGGKDTLSAKATIVIEFWPYGLDKFNSYNLLKSSLIKAEYKNCYDLNSKKYLKNLTEVSMDEIYFDYKSRKVDFTNLLFFD